MHEMALAEEVQLIVAATAERHDMTRVTDIGLAIGAWSCVVPEALEAALEVALAEGVAAGARIGLMTVPGRLRCVGCGEEYEPEDRYEPCPACGRPGAELLAGNDMTVMRVAGH